MSCTYQHSQQWLSCKYVSCGLAVSHYLPTRYCPHLRYVVKLLRVVTKIFTILSKSPPKIITL